MKLTLEADSLDELESELMTLLGQLVRKPSATGEDAIQGESICNERFVFAELDEKGRPRLYIELLGSDDDDPATIEICYAMRHRQVLKMRFRLSAALNLLVEDHVRASGVWDAEGAQIAAAMRKELLEMVDRIDQFSPNTSTDRASRVM